MKVKWLMAVFAGCGCLLGLARLVGAPSFLVGAGDDVSKSRRLELASLPRDLPFEGLDYARSGVTLAPAFLAGAPACWSWTMRL